MIFASVAPGEYLLIENTTVVGDVKRRMSPNGRYQYPDYDYVATYDGEITYHKNLVALYEHFQFENYPGYNGVMKKREKNAVHGSSLSFSRRYR